MYVCNRCDREGATIHLRSEDKDGEELLCSGCYNEMLSKELDVALIDHPESISVSDKEGESRQFTIEKMLNPLGIRLEAAESTTYGYKFVVDGELECDQNLLFEQLIEKIKRGISTTYIKKGKFPHGQHYQSMCGDQLIGRIEYSENHPKTPVLVIDGKPYSWEDVGKIMMTNEGFQLRMEVLDMTEDAD